MFIKRNRKIKAQPAMKTASIDYQQQLVKGCYSHARQFQHHFSPELTTSQAQPSVENI